MQSKPRKPKNSSNPLLYAIQKLLHEYDLPEIGEKCLPKRFTIYEPLLFLNASFEHHSEQWTAVYDSLTETERETLFESICRAFQAAGKNVTHIAINAPIEIEHEAADGMGENVMRVPSRLRKLYGNFGLAETQLAKTGQTDATAFDHALWVETAQVPGVVQIWAPEWTMFSRGNINEKARILQQERLNPHKFPGLSRDELDQELCEIDVVDLYVGIGYFALPYLKRGVRRVFGWELNSWSVEGLRRGCERNGFGCSIFEIGSNPSSELLEETARKVVVTLRDHPDTRCVAFRGDNRHASFIMQSIMNLTCAIPLLNVRHCNLGLLPSSEAGYNTALAVTAVNIDCWLHVHENTEITAVNDTKQRVLEHFSGLSRRSVTCEWVEMVKTYAPGIGHFVFDLKVASVQ